MPNMRKTFVKRGYRLPVAFLCSDVHFAERAPAARAAEPDWYAAMARPWEAMRKIAALGYDIPVIIAGDIFDHWKPSPQLINFAIGMFKGLSVYAVPGQHDLPEHNYAEMHRSGYGTLVAAGAIETLEPGRPLHVYVTVEGKMHLLDLHGFPWGFPPVSLEQPAADGLNIAVIHSYVWRPGHGYEGAPAEKLLGAYKNQLRGYDLAVFGDNHSGFYAEARDPGLADVLNCGGLQARRRDEREYQPRFGVLYSDGTVELHDVPTHEDRWIEDGQAADPAEAGPDGQEAKEFINKLVSLSGDALDFREVVRRFVDTAGLEGDVRDMVLAALDPHVATDDNALAASGQ